ncbi:MAG: hypothetical protein DRI30_00470 [Chloroflexi bacterium]|nr:MAG: hypothetical protein DRI30_00470 [Chloroflexota bacterium]
MPLRTGFIFLATASLIVTAGVLSACSDDGPSGNASGTPSEAPTPTASATPTPGPATPTPTPGEFRRLFTIPSPNEDPSSGRARAVAVNPDAFVIYVANEFRDEVRVFDEATGTLQSSYPVGENPRAVEYDSVSDLILTLGVLPKVVSIRNADSGTEVARIEVPQGYTADALAVDGAGERAYVGTASGVSIIDLTARTVEKEVPLLVTRVHDLVFDPGTGVLYALAECNKARSQGQTVDYIMSSPIIIEECTFSSALIALDGSSGEVLFEIILERDVNRIAIDSISQTVYVTGSRYDFEMETRVGALQVVDLESRAVKERIDLPWKGGSVIVVDETRRIVHVAALNKFLLLDADTYDLVKTIEGGLEPSDMALNSTTGRVYVSQSWAGIVVFGR